MLLTPLLLWGILSVINSLKEIFLDCMSKIKPCIQFSFFKAFVTTWYFIVYNTYNSYITLYYINLLLIHFLPEYPPFRIKKEISQRQKICFLPWFITVPVRVHSLWHIRESLPGLPSPAVVLLAQSCPTLWDPMDCSTPGSSVHGILQARIQEWVAIPFSRGSSRPSDRTLFSALQADSLQSELPGKTLPPHPSPNNGKCIIIVANTHKIHACGSNNKRKEIWKLSNENHIFKEPVKPWKLLRNPLQKLPIPLSHF